MAEALAHFPYRTPHGTLTIGVGAHGVCAVAFGEVDLGGKLAATELSNQTATELLEYFAGKRRAFDVPLELHGSAFQKQVWEEIGRIPYGCAKTSSEVARAIGRPSSNRAVGAALRENPLAVLVPDHRVVRADGRPLSPDARGRIRAALLQAERQRAQAAPHAL